MLGPNDRDSFTRNHPVSMSSFRYQDTDNDVARCFEFHAESVHEVCLFIRSIETVGFGSGGLRVTDPLTLILLSFSIMTRKKSKPKSKLASASEVRSSEALPNLQGHTIKPHIVPASHPLLEVPLEVWEQVAALSGRQAIARLCATSHAFYSGFAPLLYGTIPDPPLTHIQSIRLIKTLSLAKMSPRIGPLVWLIRSVCLTTARGDLKLSECQDALYSLFEVSASGWSIRGATLRCLQWHLPNAYDEALSILVRPGCFPNLREISVGTDAGNNARFDYLLIPGLEKLHCWWNFPDCGHPTFEVLKTALQLLPSLSPLLQSLKLQLSIGHNYYSWDSSPYMIAYYEGVRPSYDGLIRTINQLHFPVLISLEISMQCSDSHHSLPPTEFGPLLLSNPSTRDVVLDLRLYGKREHHARLITGAYRIRQSDPGYCHLALGRRQTVAYRCRYTLP
ncbi:hypothetical protein C8R47DRAFT_312868 [Mycena vitilis]|nr:hypothetical protein C8R47DRAFT_312868 [Mycena vitilis]